MPLDAFDLLDLAYWLDCCTWRALRWIIPILLLVVGVGFGYAGHTEGWIAAGVGGGWLLIQTLWIFLRPTYH